MPAAVSRARARRARTRRRASPENERTDSGLGRRRRRAPRTPRRRPGGRRRRSRRPCLPSRRNTTRSAIAAAPGSWVTITSVWPSVSFRSRSSSRICALERESRFPVGSSASTSSGWVSRARAIETRCCSPPESSDGRWVMRWPRPTRSSSSAARSRIASSRRPAISAGSSTFSTRAERGQQVEELEDEADAVAPEAREAVVGEPVVALAAQRDLTARSVSRARPAGGASSTCPSPTAP